MKLVRRNQEDSAADPNKQGQEAAENQKQGTGEKRGEKKYSVLVYACIMFVAVVAVILMSYLIQERNSETINSLTEQHNEFSIEALQNIEDLQNENMALREQVSQLTEERDSLEEELNEGKEAWQSEKAELTEQAQKDQEALQEEYDVICDLLDMKISVEEGNVTAAKNRAARIEPKKQLLSEEYKNLYQELLEELE